jgi:hypothetical protein
MSSLVRADNVFCGLEKWNPLAIDMISLWGLTTFDICGFRGVTSLALTTLGESVRFLPLIFAVFGLLVTLMGRKWRHSDFGR